MIDWDLAVKPLLQGGNENITIDDGLAIVEAIIGKYVYLYFE